MTVMKVMNLMHSLHEASCERVPDAMAEGLATSPSPRAPPKRMNPGPFGAKVQCLRPHAFLGVRPSCTFRVQPLLLGGKAGLPLPQSLQRENETGADPSAMASGTPRPKHPGSGREVGGVLRISVSELDGHRRGARKGG